MNSSAPRCSRLTSSPAPTTTATDPPITFNQDRCASGRFALCSMWPTLSPAKPTAKNTKMSGNTPRSAGCSVSTTAANDSAISPVLKANDSRSAGDSADAIPPPRHQNMTDDAMPSAAARTYSDSAPSAVSAPSHPMSSAPPSAASCVPSATYTTSTPTTS